MRDANANSPVLSGPLTRRSTDCPEHADCDGKNLVLPDPGFWIHWDDRALVDGRAEPSPTGPKNITVYYCGPSSCKGGNRSECTSGRTGPICGTCARMC
eukprot:2351891-Rhodomonas_salina.2